MTSRLLSQIFNQNSASIYETIKRHDAASDSDLEDLEEQAGMLPRPQSFDRQHTRREDTEESGYDPEASSYDVGRAEQPFSRASRPTSHRYAPSRYRDDDDSNEVPESLLFEGGGVVATPGTVQTAARDGVSGSSFKGTRTPSGSGSSRHARSEEQWRAATAHAFPRTDTLRSAEARKRARLGLIDPKERALWMWANVENLDNFLNEVYDYHLGKGIYTIMLGRILSSLMLLFVVSFTTFLSLCIDYNAIHKQKRLLDITKPRCMSSMSSTATTILWMMSFYWFVKIIQYLLDVRRLWEMHNFYVHLLDIPDSDMQTISWQEVVARLMALRDANFVTMNGSRHRYQSKQRMDAQDIANRLMRRENYMIALFNKDILDLTVPLPILRHKRGMLTRTLEWNLSLCIMDYVFNEQGQPRTLFLKDTHRRTLSDGLRSRFFFAGCMNILFAPFIATYFIVVYLLRNLNDFIQTPQKIGHRQYTPFAEWKFREFNELYHLFQKRLSTSYPDAEAYVEQFPKEKTAQLARFVSFVASSLLGVLAIASVVDYELLDGFEIVPGLTALTCLGVLSTIVAVSRGLIPREHSVYDPEYCLRNVIQNTHYLPPHWKDRLHSDDVKREFMTLYDLKIWIFLQEVLSVIFTPFVLWFSLPKCSDRIIDFFRENTVHVDGVGYICSFAEFHWQKPGQEITDELRKEHFSAKDNKMVSSYLNFMDQYSGDPVGKRTQPRRQRSAYPSAGWAPAPTDFAGPGASRRLPKPRGTGASNEHAPDSGGKPMMTSVLLDHYHQPPGNAFHRNAKPPTYQPSSSGSLREEAEQASRGGEKTDRYTSNLGESFMSTRLSGTMVVSDDDRPSEAGAGVLDLLNQFVGAHAGDNTGRAGVV